MPIVALCIINLVTQQFYVERSRAVRAGSFAEVPFVSDQHALSYFAERRGHWPDTVFTDEFNRSFSHIQAYYVNPSSIIFLSTDHYDSLGTTKLYCKIVPCLFAAPPSLFDATDRRIAARGQFFRSLDFRFFGAAGRSVTDRFVYDDRARDDRIHADSPIIESRRGSVLNRWNAPERQLYAVRTLGQSPNHLVFVPGSLGTALSAGTRGVNSLFPLEPDPFFGSAPFAAVGRYLLFRVLAPSARPRLELSVSATARGARDLLPHSVVVGNTRIRLPLVGRGSARVFSDVLVPQRVGGMQFVGLDMGVDETPLPEPPRSLLMRLYGRNVPLESRRITVFARDVSLIDDRDYGRLEAPQYVERFPRDLENTSLEFSGVYEDGWASEQSYFVLRSTKMTTTLHVRGVVPLIADPYFSTSACVYLDRLQLGCHKVAVADFDFAYPLGTLNAGNHEVRITFDRFQKLPGGDGRPVGMKLNFVGFQSG